MTLKTLLQELKPRDLWFEDPGWTRAVYRDDYDKLLKVCMVLAEANEKHIKSWHGIEPEYKNVPCLSECRYICEAQSEAIEILKGDK